MKINLKKATELAIKSAKKSTEKHKMAATLFYGNKYVTSPNRTFSVIVNDKKTPYSEHAEAAVITHGLHLGYDLTKCTLVVVRINSSGCSRLARPCRHCEHLCRSMNIPRIYYSNDSLRREIIPENFKSLKL